MPSNFCVHEPPGIAAPPHILDNLGRDFSKPARRVGYARQASFFSTRQ